VLVGALFLAAHGAIWFCVGAAVAWWLLRA
jgi:hypothetical protein